MENATRSTETVFFQCFFITLTFFVRKAGKTKVQKTVKVATKTPNKKQLPEDNVSSDVVFVELLRKKMEDIKVIFSPSPVRTEKEDRITAT